MMGFYGTMMHGNWGIVGVIGFMFWLVMLFDAIFLGMWLWKHTVKK